MLVNVCLKWVNIGTAHLTEDLASDHLLKPDESMLD